jgi:hypothetical protein
MLCRFKWIGVAQEATAVLTALNYLVKKFPGTVVCEVGMCGVGLEIESTDTIRHSFSSLLIGASPVAIIRYPDRRVEALEVKNHCPFVASFRALRQQSTQKHQRERFCVMEGTCETCSQSRKISSTAKNIRYQIELTPLICMLE